MISTILHRRAVFLTGLVALAGMVGLLVWSGASAHAAGRPTSGIAVPTGTAVSGSPSGVTEIGTAVAFIKDAAGTVRPYQH
jgi:hypothetical protein